MKRKAQVSGAVTAQLVYSCLFVFLYIDSTSPLAKSESSFCGGTRTLQFVLDFSGKSEDVFFFLQSSYETGFYSSEIQVETVIQNLKT